MSKNGIRISLSAFLTVSMLTALVCLGAPDEGGNVYQNQVVLRRLFPTSAQLAQSYRLHVYENILLALREKAIKSAKYGDLPDELIVARMLLHDFYKTPYPNRALLVGLHFGAQEQSFFKGDKSFLGQLYGILGVDIWTHPPDDPVRVSGQAMIKKMNNEERKVILQFYKLFNVTAEQQNLLEDLEHVADQVSTINNVMRHFEIGKKPNGATTNEFIWSRLKDEASSLELEYPKYEIIHHVKEDLKDLQMIVAQTQKYFKNLPNGARFAEALKDVKTDLAYHEANPLIRFAARSRAITQQHLLSCWNPFDKIGNTILYGP